MDKKMLFAVAMTLLTFLLFKNYFSDKPTPEDTGVVTVGGLNDAVQPGQPIKIPSKQNLYSPLVFDVAFDKKSAHGHDALEVEIDTPLVHAVISSEGATVTELSFKEHRGRASQPLSTVQRNSLGDGDRENGCFLVALDQETPYNYTMVGKHDTDDAVEVVFKADSHYCSITKTFVFHKDNYQIDLKVGFEHPSKKHDSVRPRIIFPAPFISDADTEAPHVIAWNESKRMLESTDYSNMRGRAWFWSGSNPLFGANDRYFVHALVSDASGESKSFVERAYIKQEYRVIVREMGIDQNKAVDIIRKKLAVSSEVVDEMLQKLPALVATKHSEADAHKLKNALEAAGIRSVQVDNYHAYPILEGPVLTERKSEWNLSFYMGPKVLNHISAVDSRLEEVFAFGWLSWLCRVLIQLLSIIYDYVGNFGLAIVVISIALKLPFMPLSIYTNKKMARYQHYAPSINKIRAKYRQDIMLQNTEVEKFCKEHGVSQSTPMLGCLPMLIQLPILFALYRVLWNCLDLYQAPLFGWIVDLSAKDPLYVLPVLMGVSTYWSQHVAPVRDEKQATLMLILPIVMTAVFASFPAGLVLYWLTNNVLTIVEHYVRVLFFD